MAETTKSKADAFVNGERVRGPGRSRPDKRYYNEDIAWFLVEAGGELGERGMALNMDSGGSGNPADTDHLHEQRIQARYAVVRWRRLNNIWTELPSWHQATLRTRYRAKKRDEVAIVGLSAAFGELGGLAWEYGQELTVKLARSILRTRLLAERRAKNMSRLMARWKWEALEEMEDGGIRDYLVKYPEDEPFLIGAASRDLRHRLGKFKPNGGDKVIRELKSRAELANLEAHKAWLHIERSKALWVDCPPRFQ